MEGMDLAPHRVRITMNEHEAAIPGKDAEVWCEEQIQTTSRRFYANG